MAGLGSIGLNGNKKNHVAYHTCRHLGYFTESHDVMYEYFVTLCKINIVKNKHMGTPIKTPT